MGGQGSKAGNDLDCSTSSSSLDIESLRKVPVERRSFAEDLASQHPKRRGFSVAIRRRHSSQQQLKRQCRTDNTGEIESE